MRLTLISFSFKRAAVYNAASTFCLILCCDRVTEQLYKAKQNEKTKKLYAVWCCNKTIFFFFILNPNLMDTVYP